MSKPILCLDFDGVIHSYTSRWQGAAVIPDEPVEGAIGFMLAALVDFDVVIFSSRSNQPGGLVAMRNWLKHHAGNCWYESPCGPGLEDVRFVTEKPPALVTLVTLDDRALTFTGQWPKVADLLAFKPWNKDGAIPTARSDAEQDEVAALRTEVQRLRDSWPRSAAAGDVLAERLRQINTEKWTPQHDDKHSDGSLALAAACYACCAATWAERSPSIEDSTYASHASSGFRWPWSPKWWKPKSQRRDLVRGAALIIAEIERIDRAALAAREAAPRVEG